MSFTFELPEKMSVLCSDDLKCWRSRFFHGWLKLQNYHVQYSIVDLLLSTVSFDLSKNILPLNIHFNVSPAHIHRTLSNVFFAPGILILNTSIRIGLSSINAGSSNGWMSPNATIWALCCLPVLSSQQMQEWSSCMV